MIDILKKYVDTGIALPGYQVDKLLNNRSLLTTYFRKRAIAVKQINKKFDRDELGTFSFAIENNMFKPEMIKLFFEIDSDYIDDITDPSEPVQLAAVKESVDAIKYIKKPSEDVQLYVVKKNGEFIEYIIKKGIEPSEDVQLAAVKQNGYAIQHINNPSKDVQLAAVEEDYYAIRHIENPHPSVIEYLKSIGR